MKTMHVKGQHEILPYEYSEKLKNLVYKQEPTTKYIVTKNGRNVGDGIEFSMNKELRKLFKTNNYDVQPDTKIKDRPRERLFKERVEIVKVKDDNKVWVGIEIHVPGSGEDPHQDSAARAKKIANELKIRGIKLKEGLPEWLPRGDCK